MKVNRYVGVLLSSVFLFTLGFLIPLFLLFGKGEALNPEINFTFQIYNILFLSGFIICLLGWFAYMLIKKNNSFGNSMGFGATHDKPSLSFFKNFSQPQIYTASLIIFGSVFLFAQLLAGAGSGTGMRLLPQQFTTIDNLLFTTALIPVAENLVILGAVFLLSILLQFMFIKFKINKSDYSYYAYALYFLASGVFAWVLHQTVYSGSDIAGYVVFLFWGIGGIITLASDTPYPFLAMHQMNNLFISLGLLYTNDTKLLIGLISIILLGVVYFVVWGNNWYGQKKRQEILT